MSEKIKKFVEEFYPYARESQNLTKIPAVFTLAQAALETGWGEKAEGNNLFGITANKNWTGETILVKTFEFHSTPDVKYPEVESVTYLPDKNKYKYIVRRYFRKYKSYTDCFNDHNEFLQKERYKKAFDYTDDPKGFATEVANAGYATALNYAETLHKMIDKLQSIIDELDIDQNDPAGTYGTVNIARLNVRALYLPEAPVVHVLLKDQQVRIWEKVEGWYKIRKGLRGWISTKYLNESGAIIPGSLNVRAKPVNGAVVDQIKQGTVPIVVTTEGEWVQISTEQLVMGKFVDIIVT